MVFAVLSTLLLVCVRFLLVNASLELYADTHKDSIELDFEDMRFTFEFSRGPRSVLRKKISSPLFAIVFLHVHPSTLHTSIRTTCPALGYVKLLASEQKATAKSARSCLPSLPLRLCLPKCK